MSCSNDSYSPLSNFDGTSGSSYRSEYFNSTPYDRSVLQTPDRSSRREQDSVFTTPRNGLTGNMFPSPDAGNLSGFEIQSCSTPFSQAARGTPVRGGSLNGSIFNPNEFGASPLDSSFERMGEYTSGSSDRSFGSPGQRAGNGTFNNIREGGMAAANATYPLQEVFQDARAYLDALSPGSSQSGGTIRSDDSPLAFGNLSMSDSGSSDGYGGDASCSFNNSRGRGPPPALSPNAGSQVSPRSMQGSPQAARVFDIRGLQNWVLRAIASVTVNQPDCGGMSQIDREEQTLRFMIQLVTSWRNFLQASTAFNRVPPQGSPNVTNNSIGGSPQGNGTCSYASSPGNLNATNNSGRSNPQGNGNATCSYNTTSTPGSITACLRNPAN